MFIILSYKGLGQESSFHRPWESGQAASCASSSSGQDGCSVPTFLTGEDSSLAQQAEQPHRLLGKEAFSPSLLSTPSACLLPKELLSSSLGVLESVVPGLWWARIHGNPLST